MDSKRYSSFSGIIREIIRSKKENDLFHNMSVAINKLEFDFFAYGVRIAYPVTKPTFLLKNNYPISWQRRYKEENFVEIDPTVGHGISSTAPIVWDASRTSQAEGFWEEAYASGLTTGWAQSMILAPSVVGMLTFSRNSSSISSDELFEKSPILLWLNSTFQSTYKELLLPRLSSTHNAKLSPREIEILRWCSDGKTSEEIAVILGLQARTVNFHVANAIKKLNVTNKTSAAVRAIQKSII